MLGDEFNFETSQRICVECFEQGRPISAKQGGWSVFVLITSVIGPLVILLPVLEWLFSIPLKAAGIIDVKLSPWRRWFPHKKRHVLLCPNCGAIDSMERPESEGGKYALYIKKAEEQERMENSFGGRINK